MNAFTKLKNNAGIKIKQIEARINKSAYFILKTIPAVFFPPKKISILFSEKSERENSIRSGFRLLRHDIDFNDFTPENIRKNDIVMPLTMDDVRKLEKLRPLIENNPIPIPSLKSVNICDDKYLFIRMMQKKGFGNVIPKVGNDLSYPYMLKKKVGQSGDNCYIISDAEFEEKYNDIINNPNYFCQEIVPGNYEYATHLIFKEHEVVASLNVKYLFSSDTFVKGKDEFICNKICSCPHLDLFVSILTAIEFEGICCFNYKEIDGHPLILEINPRFGGSLSTFFFSFVNRLDLSKKSKFA